MELATQAFDVLCLRRAALLEDSLKTLPELSKDTLAKARQLVRLMGLLHDVGHTGFSHAGESILPGGRHEILSAWTVSADGPLGPILEADFFEGISGLLERMLLDGKGEDKDKKIPPQLLVLARLIAGELDADRTDYLLRDSLHCGVEYGRFDHRRMIESLVVHENPDTQSLTVGIDRGGFHTVEALLMARYYMNTQVYFHRVRRAYDLLLRQWLHEWGGHNYQPLAKALDYDDLSLIGCMREDITGANGKERKRWADRLLGRKHPKLVIEWGDHANPRELQHARRVYESLKSEFQDAELFLDESGKGAIHKLFVPDDEELVDDLFIIDHSGIEHSFHELSKVVAKIPKRFWMIRIFGYFSTEEQREEVTRRSRQIAG